MRSWLQIGMSKARPTESPDEGVLAIGGENKKEQEEEDA
jgi:hypothetical protein